MHSALTTGSAPPNRMGREGLARVLRAVLMLSLLVLAAVELPLFEVNLIHFSLAFLHCSLDSPSHCTPLNREGWYRPQTLSHHLSQHMIACSPPDE